MRKRGLFIGGIVLVMCLVGMFTGTYATTKHSRALQISYPPTSIVHHADGSITYEYDIEEGKTIINLPPKDFNPLTASNSQLTKYGYPTRLTDKSQLKQWQYFVMHRVIQTPGNLVVHPNVRN